MMKTMEKFFTTFKSLTLSSPGWAYISPFEKTRDGSGTIKALHAHFARDETENCIILVAYKAIEM